MESYSWAIRFKYKLSTYRSVKAYLAILIETSVYLADWFLVPVHFSYKCSKVDWKKPLIVKRSQNFYYFTECVYDILQFYNLQSIYSHVFPSYIVSKH